MFKYLQLYHYLERLHHHLDTNKEKLFDLHVTEALNTIFPQVCNMHLQYLKTKRTDLHLKAVRKVHTSDIT